MHVSSDYVRYIPELTTFAIGEPFPFKNPNPGTEGGGLIHNTGFITLAMWSSQPDEDAPAWQYDPAIVALWAMDYLPFLVMAFPESGICNDYFFNPLKMTQDGFDAWYACEAEVIYLMLVDEQTNVLRAMRQVPVGPGMIERIKWIARQIREVFYADKPDAANRLDRRAEFTQQRVPTQQMLAESVQSGTDFYGMIGSVKRPE